MYFELFVFNRTVCKKKQKEKNKLHNKCKYERTMNSISLSLWINNPRLIDVPLKSIGEALKQLLHSKLKAKSNDSHLHVYRGLTFTPVFFSVFYWYTFSEIWTVIVHCIQEITQANVAPTTDKQKQPVCFTHIRTCSNSLLWRLHPPDSGLPTKQFTLIASMQFVAPYPKD